MLEDVEPELEEAAATLGANRWQTFARVILPAVWPALLTGFALAFARAVGEYGSVDLHRRQPCRWSREIAPLLIITKLEQYDYARRDRHCGGHAGHVFFLLLLLINLLQWWSRRGTAR